MTLRTRTTPVATPQTAKRAPNRAANVRERTPTFPAPIGHNPPRTHTTKTQLRTMLLTVLSLFTIPDTRAETIAPETLTRFIWAADPRISPNGSKIAYTQVTINVEKDTYESNLWIVGPDSAKPRQLTFGKHDRNPRWSPDGKWLAFLRPAKPNSTSPSPRKRGELEKNTQVFLLPTQAGEAKQLTNLTDGVSDITWSPDSRRILLATTEPIPPAQSDLTSLLPNDKHPKAIVVTRPTFRQDGVPDLLDPEKRSHLWKINIDGGDATPLTAGQYDERDPVFSPEGETVYFTSDRRPEPWFSHRDTNVFAILTDGGDILPAFDVRGSLESPAISPKGRTIAAIGHIEPDEPRSYNQTDLLVHDPPEIRNATQSLDFPLGDWIGSDAHPPVGAGTSHLRFTPDGQSVVTQLSRHGRCALVDINIKTGKVTDLVAGDREVVSWSMTPNGERFALLMATPTQIGEIYVFDRDGELRQLTHLQRNALPEIALTEPEEIWFDSFDGRRINGWFITPPHFDPNKQYPMILQIHGGPHMAYGYGFYQEFHVLAAAGFIVLYVNPRGSTTYGQKFGNEIQYAYPGDDYRDLMSGVDYLIAKGYVDETRLGVTGGSGGGLLTNWIITKTDRFAAAVTQRCVSDWAGFYYTADFTLYTNSWFRNAPFQNPEEYAKRSPIHYVDRVNTPLMIIHSEEDYRTPIAQGEAMFRALIARKKPVTMVRFPESSHGLSRNGKPSLRIQRMNHIVHWFDMFLNGRLTDEYGPRIQGLAKERRVTPARNTR